MAFSVRRIFATSLGSGCIAAMAFWICITLARSDFERPEALMARCRLRPIASAEEVEAPARSYMIVKRLAKALVCHSRIPRISFICLTSFQVGSFSFSRAWVSLTDCRTSPFFSLSSSKHFVSSSMDLALFVFSPGERKI